MKTITVIEARSITVKSRDINTKKLTFNGSLFNKIAGVSCGSKEDYTHITYSQTGKILTDLYFSDKHGNIHIKSNRLKFKFDNNKIS